MKCCGHLGTSWSSAYGFRQDPPDYRVMSPSQGRLRPDLDCRPAAANRGGIHERSRCSQIPIRCAGRSTSGNKGQPGEQPQIPPIPQGISICTDRLRDGVHSPGLAFRGAIDLLPEDCRRILLVIDESHHAPAEGLCSLIDEFERRGGHLHFYSATPWRQDGQRVVRPEMRVIRRSLPQHMAECYAPRHLVHQIRVLGKPGDACSAAEFHGEKVSCPL